MDRGGEIRPERKPGPGHISLRATARPWFYSEEDGKHCTQGFEQRSDVIQLQFSKTPSGFVWRMISRGDSIRRQPARGGRCAKCLLVE